MLYPLRERPMPDINASPSRPGPSAALRLLRHKSLPMAACSLLVIAGVLFCYIQQPRLMRMLDLKIYDFMLYLYHDDKPGPVPAIIDLDEKSLAEFGQWPWPRFLLAELLQKLTDRGVAAIGLDVLLLEKDRTSPFHVRKDLKQYLNVDMGFTNLLEELGDYDKLLGKRLKSMPVVLGSYGRYEEQVEKEGIDPPGVNVIQQKLPGAIPFEPLVSNAKDLLLPLPELLESAPIGLLNMNPDDDGIVRRIPLLSVHDGKFYPTLSLRTLMRAMSQRNLILRVGEDGLQAVRVGPFTIPTPPDGNIVIPYRGTAKTYPYFSAADVLKGDLPEGALRNRIVFIGTSAAGLLDIRITPLERVYPGVEVHATVLDAILQQRFLFAPPWTPGAQALAVILCGLLAAAAFGLTPPRVYLLAGAGMLGATIYASAHLFKQGVFFSPLYIAIVIVLQGGLLLFMRFRQEEKQKNVLRGAFSRYVAPEVVERIARLSGNIFAGEERELSIMFTDIRGFTSISENLGPEKVVALLNRYFTPMTALVRGSKGTLDKFIGDALMAYWNAPLDVPDHPRLAVGAALGMQKRLDELNVKLVEDFGLSIKMGVGLHTGKAYVGNMGSEELLNYTLIGDSVNLASRLEGLCPKYGVGLVVSADTKTGCGDSFAFQLLDELRVKGKKKSVLIYTAMPLEEGEARAGELADFEAARSLYAKGNFAGAGILFAALAETFPDHGLYRLYSERCSIMVETPPEAWDGVWTMTSK